MRAEETEARVLAIRARVPITRLSDLTPLDPIRLPVFAAITPLARDLTTHLGKGVDAVSARVSALMEAVERVSAEQAAKGATRRGSFTRLSRAKSARPIDPVTLHLPADTRYAPDETFTWVESHDLVSGDRVWMAADLALTPPSEGILRDVDTNGLASGNTLLEAIVHGLCEVIERDVQSQLDFTTAFGDAGVPLPPLAAVAPESLPTEARAWLDRLRETGLDARVQDATGDLGVATFRTVLADYDYPTPAGPVPMLFTGWGTAPHATAALLRSITEAVQARLGFIQGARDSFNVRWEGAHATSRAHRRQELDPARVALFPRTPSFESLDLRDDLEFLLGRLRAAGLERVIVTDLTRKDLGIPVVRVRVPGLSCFTVNQRRVDWRCLRHLL
ncbi:YcaO-like family protein [Archangium violaceum]|uniref:YcaO-like family protein n=1 Tax=Archangium violaceum TaxID=83451 RepID=UPI00194DC2D0|nr:YcaO-like family protein [Archangium violaceum]QRO00153.1 YcaO-like family protein [Archangium violaceum]